MFKSFGVAVAAFAVGASAWKPSGHKQHIHDESYSVPSVTKTPKRPGNPFHPGAPTYDESYSVPEQTKVPKRPGNPGHPGLPAYDESYAVP